MSSGWKRIWDPVGTVAIQEQLDGASGDIFATKIDMDGPIHVYKPYEPTKWQEIGGPGKMFVCDDQHL